MAVGAPDSEGVGGGCGGGLDVEVVPVVVELGGVVGVAEAMSGDSEVEGGEVCF